MTIDDKQCGRCAHYGEDDSGDEQLVAIRVRGEAPPDYRDSCSHPAHVALRLRISPNGTCDGFAPALAA